MDGVQDVLACVRLLAPQLEEKADSVLEAYIVLAEPFVDAEKFGPFYVQAIRRRCIVPIKTRMG